MAIKGRIPIQYNGKVQTFYPKTLIDQVIVDGNMNLAEKISDMDKDIANEMFDIIKITHNKNKYVVVNTYSYEDGAGIGGAGNSPSGGDNPVSIGSSVELVDMKNIMIKLPEPYNSLGKAAVNKYDNETYFITFANSNKCVMVILS